MATVVVKFAPNVIKDDSPLNAEGGVIDADKMRNRQGSWQTIKGWVSIKDENGDALTITEPCRGAHAWADLNGSALVAFGTPNKLYVLKNVVYDAVDEEYQGELQDITPPYHSEGTLQGLKQDSSGDSEDIDDEDARPFKRLSNTLVEVRHTRHGLVAGDSVTLSHAISYGSGAAPSGTYTVQEVTSPNTYTIPFASSGNVNATGGGNVDYQVAWRAGVTDGDADTDPTVWSLANYGEALLAVRKGEPIYVWYPNDNYDEIWVNADAALGTGWTHLAGTYTKTAGTASNLSLNIKGFMTPGKIYRVIFTVSNSQNNSQLKLQMNYGSPAAVADIGDASLLIVGDADGTYSRLIVCPDDPVDIVFAADNAFAGTISGISVKPEADATIVDEAPKIVDHMWMDYAAHIVHVAGTFEADGDYNPLVVRNSSQDNFRTWVPDANNLADEFVLGNGSRVVGVCPTRQQTLIYTDDGVISQQFTGSSGEVYAYRLLGTGCGLIGANAKAEINGQVFWLSNNKNLYTFQGAIPQIVQSWRFRRDVADNIARYQDEKIYLWINSENNEVWGHYPDTRDGDECSRVFAYNWIEDHSVPHTFDRTAGVSAGLLPHPIMVSSSGGLYFHEVGNAADTANLEAFLETAWFDIEDGENLQAISGLIPDFDDRTGYVLFKIMTRANPGAPVTTKGPLTYTSALSRLLCRVLGRQGKLRIYSNAPESFWVLGALKMMIQKVGALR